ncbi:hypothetical protein [Haloarcula salinisoli]|uniref:hypothetical protein n=1 Tax=Haloarcula salinisoli TaxID=2487746 RepID=UPI001C733B6D|nr:hypothetical protein [Halomicroarcula salinisoli]
MDTIQATGADPLVVPDPIVAIGGRDSEFRGFIDLLYTERVVQLQSCTTVRALTVDIVRFAVSRFGR